MGGRRPTGLARSMTSGARSIGARSDWGSTNGDTDAETNDDEGEEDDPKANGGPSRTWSIYKDDGSKAKSSAPTFHDDPDDPINRYVQDQLQRLKTNESAEMSEEISAQNDGANDDL